MFDHKAPIVKCLLIMMIIGGLITASFVYLNRALSLVIEPARFTCWSEQDGAFLTEQVPVNTIYGIGLAYARHINETASDFDPLIAPPVFIKATSSLHPQQGVVNIPDTEDLFDAVDTLEPGLSGRLREQDIELTALLDYEVELAFVLLESVSEQELKDPEFVPQIGFMLVNDISARSIAVLGEGQENRYEYWGLSKSFPGFTPLSEKVWVPSRPSADGLPCVSLQTHVNGILRQREVTDNLIYQPKEMLYFIKQRYPDAALQRGDLILTGTPGGVIFNIPRWKSRLAELLGLNRFQKLVLAQQAANADRFLKSGDQVRVSGEWLGEVKVKLN